MKTVKVHDVLRRGAEVVAIDAAATLREAVAQMRAHGIHHLIVRERGETVGIVSSRDLFDRGLLPEGCSLNLALAVSGMMQRCSAAVTEETTLSDALASMARARLSALPVERDGVLTGILTESDLVGVLGRLLETEASTLGVASREGRIVMSNPVVQNAFQLLAEAGI